MHVCSCVQVVIKWRQLYVRKYQSLTASHPSSRRHPVQHRCHVTASTSTNLHLHHGRQDKWKNKHAKKRLTKTPTTNQSVQKTSTTLSCSGPIPAQESRGNSRLGVVFSHTIPKMDFRYSHRFSWEKNTLNWYITCHGYINIHHSPFIGPIKINHKFWKITALGSWRSWNERYLFPS